MRLDDPFSSITPTLDGRILSVLGSADVRHSAPGLAALTSGSPNGVRQALERLVGSGLVNVLKVGNTSGYALNRKHLLAGPVLEIVRSRERLVATISERISGFAVKPLYAAMFGSAASGEMRAESDVDLLFVTSDGEGYDGGILEEDIGFLAVEVSEWTGNDCRPLIFEESQVSAAEPVFSDAAEAGILLWGQPRWLARRLSRSVGAA